MSYLNGFNPNALNFNQPYSTTPPAFNTVGGRFSALETAVQDQG